MTLGEIRREMIEKPTQYLLVSSKIAKSANKKSKRTRKRVENPKQQYVYASQKRTQKTNSNKDSDDKNDDSMDAIYPNDENSNTLTNIPISPMAALAAEAKLFGLIPSMQNCDPPIIDSTADGTNDDIDTNCMYPRIVGKIQVGDDPMIGDDFDDDYTSRVTVRIAKVQCMPT